MARTAPLAAALLLAFAHTPMPAQAGTLAAAAATPAGPATGSKKKITRADELPRRTYALPKLPSELLDAPATALLPLAEALDADIAADLAAFDIADRSSLEGMLQTRMLVAALRGDFAKIPPLTAELRRLADKPAAQMTTGLIADAVARARLAGGDEAAQRERVRAELAQRYGALPWDVVEATLKQTRSQYETMNPAIARGAFQSQVDVAARNAGMRVPAGIVTSVLGARMQAEHLMPFRGEVVTVLTALIDRHANAATRPDIWTSRLVTLPPTAKAQPVTIGIWDSGLDPALFRMADGGGIAFDADSRQVPDLLRPLGELQAQWPTLRGVIKGAMDAQAAQDTPEARSFRQRMSQMKPDEVKPFVEATSAAGMYVHGTHVAGIAVEGNPFARVFAVSMHWSHLMTPPKPTMERSRATAAAYRQAVDAMKAAGVRVVNMSWRYGPGAYEAMLGFHGVGKDGDERKKIARELFKVERDALEQAIASAPQILFVAGSGNEDNDASFVEYIPAGLSLPNLITAGAVDAAGEETSFSTFGKTVVVHANGKDVLSLVPGGDKLKLSGTSMAAPQVANLAAKLIALNPALTPMQVKALILKNVEARGRVRLIDPRATLRQAGFAG